MSIKRRLQQRVKQQAPRSVSILAVSRTLEKAMEKLALWVEFDIDPAQIDAFLAAARDDARGAIAEPGCRCFDILRDAQQPSHIHFYEIYDDQAAFDAHAKTAHYKRFIDISSPMITAKSVHRLSVEVGSSR